MLSRRIKFAIGTSAFALSTLGLGALVNLHCEGGCIESAAAQGAFRNVGESLKEAGVDMKIHFESDEDSSTIPVNAGKHVQLVSKKTFKKVLVESRRSTIVIGQSPDDSVQLGFTGYRTDKSQWTVDESSDTLKLELKKTGPVEVEVLLPKDFQASMELNNVSGHTKVKNLAAIDDLKIQNVSGDVELSVLPPKLLTIKTVSGDVSLKSEVARPALAVHYEAVSGDLKAQLAGSLQSLDCETVSGDAELDLGKNPNYTIDFQSVSGDIETKGPIQSESSPGRKKASSKLGKGENSLKFQTISGDVKLLHAL